MALLLKHGELVAWNWGPLHVHCQPTFNADVMLQTARFVLVLLIATCSHCASHTSTIVEIGVHVVSTSIA
jgi:hypothetical protein